MKNKLVAIVGMLSLSVVLSACNGDADVVANNIGNVENTVVIPYAIPNSKNESEDKKNEPVNNTEGEDAKSSDTNNVEIKEDNLAKEPEEAIQKEVKVTPASGKMYANKHVNIRKGPSTDSEKVGTLNKGESVSLTGISENGWYRFEYNGEAAFVSSMYLIDELTYKDLLAKEETTAKTQEETSQKTESSDKTEEQGMVLGVKSDLVEKINAERAANGVSAIAEDARLDELAQIRAEEIVEYFEHTRPNGSSCFTVLDEGGVIYAAAGENIAAGQETTLEVMDSWMNSPAHRSNILNDGFGKVGIGYAKGGPYGTYWVQIFTD